MENFKTSLTESVKKSKTQFYIFLATAVVYLLNGFIHILDSNRAWEGLIWIIGGILFIIAAFYNRKFTQTQFIEVTDDYIKYKQGRAKEIKIITDDIININFKPLAIQITTKESNFEISLAEVGYKKVLSIKEKFNELISERGIA